MLQTKLINNRYNKIIFIILLLITVFVRFYGISEESIFGDEGKSLFITQQSLSYVTSSLMENENAPLFYIILNIWLKIFDISVPFAKGLSALFSVLTAVVIFFGCKKIMNREAAIYAVLFYVFSNFQQYYAHVMRPYALLSLLVALSVFLFFSLMQKPKIKYAVFLGITNLLLLFTHYVSVYFLFLQFISAFVFMDNRRVNLKYYIASTIGVFMLFLPWAIIVVFNNIPESGSFWIQTPKFGQLYFVLHKISGAKILFFIHIAVILISILGVILRNKIKLFKKRFDVKLSLVLLGWYIFPVVIGFIVGQITPVFLDRYFIYINIPLFVLLGYIISHLNIKFAFRLVALAVIMFFTINKYSIRHTKPENWKEIVARVKNISDDNTMIIISAWYKFRAFSYYFDKEDFKDYNNTLDRLAKNNVYATNGYGLNKINITDEDVHKVIFIECHRKGVDPKNNTYHYIIKNGYKLANDFRLADIKVNVFKRN